MWYAKCYIRAKGKGKCYGNNHFNQDGNGGLAVFQGAVTAPVPDFYNESWIEREARKEQRKKWWQSEESDVFLLLLVLITIWCPNGIPFGFLF